MKTNYLMMFAVATFSLSLLACGDDDSSASYEVTLQGVVEQIDYLDGSEEEEDDVSVKALQNDNESSEKSESTDINYRDLISEVFEQLEVVGEKSRIHETATVEYNNIAAAELLCFQQANQKILKKLESISLAQLKTMIFQNHADLMNEYRIISAEDIPITQVNARIVYVTGDPSKYLIYNREYK